MGAPFIPSPSRKGYTRPSRFRSNNVTSPGGGKAGGAAASVAASAASAVIASDVIASDATAADVTASDAASDDVASDVMSVVTPASSALDPSGASMMGHAAAHEVKHGGRAIYSEPRGEMPPHALHDLGSAH